MPTRINLPYPAKNNEADGMGKLFDIDWRYVNLASGHSPANPLIDSEFFDRTVQNFWQLGPNEYGPNPAIGPTETPRYWCMVYHPTAIRPFWWYDISDLLDGYVQQLTWDCVTGDLGITGPGGNTVNISLLEDDLSIIADITNPMNRPGGVYTGPIDPTTCLGSWYYDVGTQIHYQFNGINWYMLDSGNLNLMIDVTHGDLMTLIAGNFLIPGMWYRITDYQTIHIIPYTTDLNTDSYGIPIEPIIIQASGTNKLFPRGYSDVYRNHIMWYDPEDSIMQLSIGFNIYYIGVGNDPDNTVNLNNVVGLTGVPPNSWSVVEDIILDGDFGIGFIGFTLPLVFLSAADYGTAFTIDPNIVPGEYTYILDPVWAATNGIDLDINGGNSKIAMIGNMGFGSRPGWVNRRIDTISQIDTPYDFVSCVFRRRYIDMMSIPDWNPGNYAIYEMVLYSGTTIYISLIDNNDTEPGSSSTWMSILDGYTHLPLIPVPNNPIYGMVVLPVSQDYQDFYTFSTWMGGLANSDWSRVTDFKMSTDIGQELGINSNMVFYIQQSVGPIIDKVTIGGQDITDIGGYFVNSDIKEVNNSILCNMTDGLNVKTFYNNIFVGTPIQSTIENISKTYVNEMFLQTTGTTIENTLINGFYTINISTNVQSSIFNGATMNCEFGQINGLRSMTGMMDVKIKNGRNNLIMSDFRQADIESAFIDNNFYCAQVSGFTTGSSFIGNTVTDDGQIYRLTIGHYCYMNTFTTIENVSIGDQFLNNILFNAKDTSFGHSAIENIINCQNISGCEIGNNFQWNFFDIDTPGMMNTKIGESCMYNFFYYVIDNNTIGNMFIANTFGPLSNVLGCTIGNNFQYNIVQGVLSFSVFSDETIWNLWSEVTEFGGNRCGPYFGYNQFEGISIKYNRFDSRFGYFGNLGNIILDTFEHNVIGPNCHENIWEGTVWHNSFGSEYCSNTHASGVRYNTFDSQCNSNTFDAMVNLNYFKNLSNCVFSDAVDQNNIFHVMNSCIVPVAFVNNTSFAPINSVNFLGATLVSAAGYTKEIVQRPDATLRIRWLDNADNANIDAITA